MNRQTRADHLLSQLDDLNEQQLRRLLVEHLTRQKLGLYWESNLIERDAALNADIVLPRRVEAWCHTPQQSDNPNRKTDSVLETESVFLHRNLIIEGDNFDALRLLKATHAGKIRVIYIDPPYNTGNKDWVYNDRYVGANDRWRHSQWLEFLYRRLTLARDLLTTDGVIMVSINDENRARLELLMDEVFPGMRVGSFVWKTRQGSNDAKGAFLSVDHEHVIVYANDGFSFIGFEKTYQTYYNPDNDPFGVWSSDTLSCAKNYKERPNLFYPIIDPLTGISYPCNPERVWVYASKNNLYDGQMLRAKTMEEYIADGKVIFPTKQRVEIWSTMESLLNAIDNGDVPGSGNTLMLRRELPELDFWIGRPVGFGRPRFKRYKTDLVNDTKPLSSWIVPNSEKRQYDTDSSFVAGSNQEGARDVLAIFGNKTFHYPKPRSLLLNLLSQSTRPNDIVLDFFAGSGTTGQAVLELNAEDGGQRRFILCSNTEATAKEPEKNLCRDVCAERVRRVISGYGGKPGYPPEQGGEFAYLQLDKFEPADVLFEATMKHAYLMLALKRLGGVRAMPEGKLKWLGRLGDCDVVLCEQVNAKSVKALAAWPKQTGAARLAVYSPRPVTVREQLAALGVEANCYGLLDVLLRGQGGNVWQE